MEPDKLQTFIEEASVEMPALRRGIFTLSHSGSGPADLAPLLVMVNMLQSGASECGAPDAEIKAAELESGLAALTHGEWPAAQTAITDLLDRLANFEESLLQNYLGGAETNMDVAAFVDESFDSLRQPAEEVWAMEDPKADDDDAAGFDIDEELLEIFALEAEGLLKNIESSLETLSSNPHDRDALWEIRRSAHTYKGAAGIVGFKKPSELAHRVEDLLDRMAEADFRTAVPVFDVLRKSSDCLQSMTSGDHSAQLAARIAEVYEEFDRVLEALNAPAEAAPAATRPDETGIPEPVFAPSPETTPAVIEIPDVPAPEAKPPHRKRSIVRVSLDRLDHLVRITRDLLMDRSVFEQRLRDLELQIDELHNATRRLQNTSSKLEIDFEASMLGGPVAGSRGGITFGGIIATDAAKFNDLEFDRYTEFHQSTRQLSEASSDTVAIGNALDLVHGSFETLFDHQRRLVEEMQEKLMSIRMVEFSSLATRLQRVVTVTCEDEGKKARLTLRNSKIELDTQILDALAEPLMHLLKNAVVHGIEPADTRRMFGKCETGEIIISLENQETHVELTITDDGRGIGLAALKEKAVATGRISRSQADSMTDRELGELIFMPGLTTAEKLNLSAGRGVGMSIVKESLESHRGQISIESSPQKGTSFIIRMPLTLAVTNALLVKAGRQTLAVPLKLISRISEIADTEIVQKNGLNCVEIGGESVPLRPLSELIASSHVDDTPKPLFNAMRIEYGGMTTLVTIDEIVRAEEVVIKPLGRPLENISGILGAAILGNGELVPILDMPHLLNTQRTPIEQPPPAEPAGLNVLIVDDSPSVRHLTSKVVAKAGWSVSTAKDGIDALEQLKAATNLPDIILSDIEMPRMDGYELVSTLRRSDEFAGIPVIMITSRAGAKHQEKAAESGVSEYLTKPFDDKELISAIERLTNVPA